MPASGRHGRTTSEHTLDLIRRLARQPPVEHDAVVAARQRPPASTRSSPRDLPFFDNASNIVRP